MTGKIFLQDDVFVFQDMSTSKIYEIPKDSEKGYSGQLYEYEIFEISKDSPITDLVDINENIITINGKEYVNQYSNPLMAINRDENDKVISLTLHTKEGKPRTFKKYAEEIAYSILLQTYNKLENETSRTREEIKPKEEPIGRGEDVTP